jgi:hypothetical protein
MYDDVTLMMWILTGLSSARSRWKSLGVCVCVPICVDTDVCVIPIGHRVVVSSS